MIDLGRSRRGQVVPALLGDCGSILAVLAVGIAHHRGVAGLVDVVGVAETVAPFLLGWVLVAPLLGAYSERALSERRPALFRGVGAWIGAAIVGAGIRATPAVGGGATPTFVVVVAGTGGVAIAAWRLLRHELLQ